MLEPSEVEFHWRTLADLENYNGDVVLVRVDFNVPLSDEGNVTDKRRLLAALPTLRILLERDLTPVLMSHLGRPGGQEIEELSLEPLVSILEDELECSVRFADDCLPPSSTQMVEALNPGEVGLLENLRFHDGEKAKDEAFSEQIASLGDSYVNDAFGTSHRNHASIAGIPNRVDHALSGELLEKEYRVLSALRENPPRPFVVLLGGAKVSDKFPLIKEFLEVADTVLIGGAMAHTFFVAQGHQVGDSLVEEDRVDEAEELLHNRDEYSGELVLPVDVTAENYAHSVKSFNKTEIPDGWSAKDIGPGTLENFGERLDGAESVFWNGPLGVFEEDPFEEGTRSIVNRLADHDGYVVVGGGDSGAAVSEYSSVDSFYHVSTGGGAALELMKGNLLPGYESLDRIKTSITSET